MNGGSLMTQMKESTEPTIQMSIIHTIPSELMPQKIFPESQTQISTNLFTMQSSLQMVTTKAGSTKTIRDFILS
jgi:hypothetical protein